MNSCIFTGRLTRDPEFKNVNTKSLVNFSLAVQETKDKAFYFEFIAWEKTADLINQYCKKGNKILVECSAVQEIWDGQDGKKNYKIKFRVNRVEFLESKKENSQSEGNQELQSNPEDIF